jgi:dihydrofolate synthase/folylpolyglutamate synthase
MITVTHAGLDGAVFSFGAYKDMKLNLLGTYQPRNAAVVLRAVDILRAEGLAISESAVREGLATVSWRGRFELLANDPPIIFDGAHNAQGIVAAVDGIRHYFGGRIVYVMTCVLQDKDYHAIARTLATVAGRAFVLTPDNPRALTAEEYAAVLRKNGVSATPTSSIREAVTLAVSEADKSGDAIVCLGSLYTYCEIIPEIEKLDLAKRR